MRAFREFKAIWAQAQHLFAALREGTPNRKQIALQIIKDGLDESSFEAAPAGVATRLIPKPLEKAAVGVVERLLGSGNGEKDGDKHGKPS